MSLSEAFLDHPIYNYRLHLLPSSLSVPSACFICSNLFENIMKENFPNLAKEIDFQGVQEALRVPKKLDPRRNTPRHIIITLAKIKDKERILKAARKKNTVTYKGVPIRL